jgi:hypothetical protein
MSHLNEKGVLESALKQRLQKNEQRYIDGKFVVLCDAHTHPTT